MPTGRLWSILIMFQKMTSRSFLPPERDLGIEQIRMGMGSFISLDHVYEGQFDRYEGYIRSP